METLTDLMLGLTSGVLTVPLVSFVLNTLMTRATTAAKKVTAYGVSFGLGTVAYFILAWYQQTELPVTPQAYLDALWPVWTAAFWASQAVLMAAKGVGAAK